MLPLNWVSIERGKNALYVRQIKITALDGRVLQKQGEVQVSYKLL
jgi:hypothetical protein